MNYSKIFRQAIDEIKSKWELPTSGFLAGGSISNVVWNIVTGKDAPVNDLDIYHLQEIKTDMGSNYLRKKQHFIRNEKEVYEDYTGIQIGYTQKGYYTIEKVSVNGIFNDIDYIATVDDRSLILDSFDINACQLGYDIEKDEFIWTKNFEEFLKTGELRLCNLTSPPHSAIRLVKKKHDLGAILPDLELDIICAILGSRRFIDTQKSRFKDRYANLFKKYESDLKSRFKLVREEDLEEYLKFNLGVDDKIWSLESIDTTFKINFGEIPGLLLSKDFLYYSRNILNNKELEKAWFKLHPVIDSSIPFDKYFDMPFDKNKVRRLGKLITHAPNSSKNLKGLSFSEQLNVFDTILSKFPNDPLIAIKILENFEVKNYDINDEMELLLMELSIRKELVEDPKDKVYHILGIETWNSNNQVGR